MLAAIMLALGVVGAQVRTTSSIPKTWDEQAIETLEVPLANPVGSPKHPPADYYDRIPVAPIYKNYPVYAPAREPAGYFDSLKQLAPEIVWDDAGHRPPLETEADWIRAGEIVFDAPVQTGTGPITVDDVRSPEWWANVGWTPAADGTLPILRYVVRQKGTATVETLACANCHTRLLPDGSILKGAQGNYAIGRANNLRLREAARGPNADAAWRQQRTTLRGTFATPWLNPDPFSRLETMSFLQYVDEVQGAFPAGVIPAIAAAPSVRFKCPISSA